MAQKGRDMDGRQLRVRMRNPYRNDGKVPKKRKVEREVCVRNSPWVRNYGQEEGEIWQELTKQAVDRYAPKLEAGHNGVGGNSARDQTACVKRGSKNKKSCLIKRQSSLGQDVSCAASRG